MTNLNQKLKNKIIEILKKDERIWNEEKTELNQTLLLDLTEKIDEKVIDLLLQEKDLRDKFFVKIKDVYVFKTNEFRFFMEENKVYNSYTQYKNQIGLTDGKRFLKDTEDLVLNWPFKDCVLEGGMTKEDEKNRNEIFFNEILAKDEIDRLTDEKTLVNWKKYTAKGEEKVKEFNKDEKTGTIKDNLIIKGNNLLALHSLKKEFAGKVKLIYIDPPYNRDADSFYNDNFKRSTWLTFMKNRLKIAENLLHQNGIIFVQIDEKQGHYLKVLMDEIFGEENFLSTITCKVKGPSGVASGSQFIFDTNEYIHVYQKKNANLSVGFKVDKEVIDENSKTIENYYYVLEKINLKNMKCVKELDIGVNEKVRLYRVSVNDYEVSTIPKKDRNQAKYIKDFKKIYRLQTMSGGTEKRILNEIKDDEMYLYEYTPTKGKNKGKTVQNLVYKGGAVSMLSDVAYLKEEKNNITPIRQEYVTNSWMDGWWQGIAKEGDVELKNGKKPEQLIKRIIEMSTAKGDLVLDYHLGSGTTCAVAHKMNRQYIGIEQLNYGENDSVARLKNAIAGDQTGISKDINWMGGGEFIYCELAKYNEIAKEKILACKNLKELEKLFDELYEKYFLNYNLKIKQFKEKTLKEEGFKSLSLNEQKKLFLEMLDLNQMYVNKTEMADKKFNISKEDQKLTFDFYSEEN